MADLQDITDRIGGLQYFIEVDGGATSKGEIAQRLRDLGGQLTEIQRRLESLAPVAIDTAAIAAAIASLGISAPAIAAAVAKELGKDLANG